MFDLNSPAMKVFMGKDITDKERKALDEENIKYALVKFLYIEKLNSMGVKLVNFSFTPVGDWMNTPTIDMVNSLVDLHVKIESGELKSVPISFNDATPFHKSTGELVG